MDDRQARAGIGASASEGVVSHVVDALRAGVRARGGGPDPAPGQASIHDHRDPENEQQAGRYDQDHRPCGLADDQHCLRGDGDRRGPEPVVAVLDGASVTVYALV